MNVCGMTLMSINDPEMVQELFTTKNKLVDKTGVFQQVFEDHMGDSFVFERTTPHWKAKRQACGTMFYKGKLEIMMGVFKKKIVARFYEWLEEIDESPDKQTVIDISKVWENLFFDNISHICFGSDVAKNMKVDIDVREGGKFVRKRLSIQEAVHEVGFALIDAMMFKWFNPVYQTARKVTGIKNFTSYQKTLSDNGVRLNNLVKEYV